LFADISGYTPLTQALMAKLGPKLGAELLTRHINHIFELLITEVHRYQGSIIGFGGDAITCWFDGDDGQRGTTCALNMQQVMQQFTQFDILPDLPVSLAIKVVAVVGAVRRFQIGDPQIQLLDVIAGATLDYMAAAEKVEKGKFWLARLQQSWEPIEVVSGVPLIRIANCRRRFGGSG
jgi:class 3 adenylate cyclase